MDQDKRRPRDASRIFSAFLGALVLATLWAGPAGAELYGYAELRWLRLEGAGPAVPEYVTVERLRPTFVEELENLEGVSFTVTPEFSMTQLESEAPHYDEYDDYLSVERLYADVKAGPARLRLGRQALNWGSGLIWNPTDVFQEVFLTDYWAERKGQNAFRAYLPLEHDLRFTAAMATGDTAFANNRYALKASLRALNADSSVIWMDDNLRDRLVWGLDIKGDAVIGYWVEAAAFAPKNRDDDPFAQAVLGIDYSFPILGTLYLAAQYYYDGSGQADPADYDWAGLISGERSTLGMHYANVIVSAAPDPDLAVNVTAIYNLDDSTCLVTPHLIYSYRDLRVTGGTNLFAGPEGGEFKPRRSQDPFKLRPRAIYYVWARWYF